MTDRMRSYLNVIAGAVLLAAVVFMIRHDQLHYAEGKGYDIKCIQTSDMAPRSTPFECKVEHSEKATEGDSSAPWWDIFFTWPEGVTALLLLGTLVAIAWQSHETRKAAEASNKQAAIQREMLRPRLAVSNFLNDVFREAVNGERVDIKIKLSNSGGMPAYSVITETWIEFVKRGTEDRPFRFTSQAKHHKATPINVDTANGSTFHIPLARRLTDDEIDQAKRAIATVCFRIRLTYNAFGDSCHYDEAFAMKPNEAESIAEYSSAN